MDQRGNVRFWARLRHVDWRPSTYWNSWRVLERTICWEQRRDLNRNAYAYSIVVGSGIGEGVRQLRQSIASLTLTPTRLPTFFFDAPKSLDFVGHSFPIVATDNGLIDGSVTRAPHRIFQRSLAMAIDYAQSLSVDDIRIAKAISHVTALPESKNFSCPKFRPRSRERRAVDKLWITLKSREENSKHAHAHTSLRLCADRYKNHAGDSVTRNWS